jgi:hypothetical protein
VITCSIQDSCYQLSGTLIHCMETQACLHEGSQDLSSASYTNLRTRRLALSLRLDEERLSELLGTGATGGPGAGGSRVLPTPGAANGLVGMLMGCYGGEADEGGSGAGRECSAPTQHTRGLSARASLTAYSSFKGLSGVAQCSSNSALPHSSNILLASLDGMQCGRQICTLHLYTSALLPQPPSPALQTFSPPPLTWGGVLTPGRRRRRGRHDPRACSRSVGQSVSQRIVACRQTFSKNWLGRQITAAVHWLF